jgi:2-oxoacid dehydrogenases acyltransferase (catalytic domain)
LIDTAPRVVPGAKSVPPEWKQRRRRRDRVALSTWSRSRDAKIGCTIKLEWDTISSIHPNIVPVALVGFALARALASNPAANRRVALWSIKPHKSVRISFAVDANNDLRIAVVDRADSFTASQFQHALRLAAKDARAGVGPVGRATSLVEMTPVVIGRPVLKVWSLLTAGFGIGLMGIPGAPFGAALISSVERFKLPAAEVPFVPFTRCALICSVGAITPSPVVRHGEVAVVDVVEVSVSFDHRICDATQLASLLEAFTNACYSVDRRVVAPTDH